VLGVNPHGAVDPELLLLRLDAVEENGADDLSLAPAHPLAVLANYACHAVCLSSNSYAISADWPGVTRRAAEGTTGASVAFVQGACADINPLGGPQDRFDSAYRLGTAVAEELARVHQGISLRRDGELAAARRTLWLPLLGPTDRDGEPVPPFEALAAQAIGLPPSEVHAYLEQRFPWAADVIQVGPGDRAGELEGGRWHARAELQAIRLSDWALVAVSAEPFVETGLAVKARSPATMTMFGGYTNGSLGYLPIPAAYQDGGYEVDTAHLYYRLPAPPAPSCAERVTSAALGLIAELLDRDPDESARSVQERSPSEGSESLSP
jgi:neutral ceramidase